MSSRTRFLWTVFALGALAAAAEAAEPLAGKTYHFGTHPARTTVTFVSEADLETIHGVTHQLAGHVQIDAEGAAVTSGKLTIQVADLRTGIDLRDEHLRSDQWLDARRHPAITLAMKRATEGKDGRTWSWTADLTIKGITREVSGQAAIRPIPEAIGKQLGAGSWVRVRTDFEVDVTQFGVKIPQNVASKVERVWSIGVDLYGTTAAPKGR